MKLGEAGYRDARCDGYEAALYCGGEVLLRETKERYGAEGKRGAAMDLLLWNSGVLSSLVLLS